MSQPARVRVERLREAASATTLELFFDLVFVFALTQITALMAEEPNGTGLLRGTLLMAVVWLTVLSGAQYVVEYARQTGSNSRGSSRRVSSMYSRM